MTAESPLSATATPVTTEARRGLRRVRGWLWFVAKGLCGAAALLWGTLAVHYSNLPWPWLRSGLAVAFALFGIWALWGTSRPRMQRVFTGLFLAVVVWFISIQPSHDRPWRPEVQVMPRAYIEGDRVRIIGVRNFEYRSRDDFTVRHEEREVDLSHLTSMDLFVSYWKPGPVAHTFVSFNFDNAPPVCISIETRPEIGEGFAPVASMFKQFELIYLVGDERDIVGVRTCHRGEQVFLYPIRASPERVRQLFLVYLGRINQLAERPEFYHLLKNSCTVNIVRHANTSGRIGQFHISHLLNGWIDRYLFQAGLVETSLPLEELRRRSRINDAAQAHEHADDFSQRIRAGLP